ncbi:calpain family cysteine protease [Nitzschia inconspicua]|uniref:Calpain family cysteine protease n=1 Tax=Nitzschia inconspicua TaxID=303405 RepID=A0A9K3LF44_9STRA|nr:calpain family cysteine protease [Nitzschia inconspicua]
MAKNKKTKSKQRKKRASPCVQNVEPIDEGTDVNSNDKDEESSSNAVDDDRPPTTQSQNNNDNNDDNNKTKKKTPKRSKQKKPTQAVARRQGGVNNLYTPAGCGLCFFKFRMHLRIFRLENRRKQRMQQFGIDYTNMVMDSTVPLFKRRCLRDAMNDIDNLNEEIDRCYDAIDHKVEELESGIQSKRNGESKPKRQIQRNPENKLPKGASTRNFMSHNYNTGKEDANRPMSVVNLDKLPPEFQGPNVEKWTYCEWNLLEYKTNGGWSKTTEGDVEMVRGKSIGRAVAKFQAHPKLFVAMFYPTEMLEWPVEEQQYTMIYRDGTTGLKPKGISKRGKVTFLMHQYQPLPSFTIDKLLPKTFHDSFTNRMTYRGKKLVTKSNPALLPGRGMGLIDDPTLNKDNTKNLDQMPFADGRPNIYTVSLYDLRTWTEVDIVVDERLPVRTDGSGRLFGAKPSKDGELWVCYLEKAIAAHCGGWDQIEGGQCTHAWALLTGNRHQFIIQRSMADPDLFCCTARYDPERQEWAEHDNSPSGGDAGIWEVSWPEVGGGGDDLLDDDELFARMCAWSDSNYLVAASTKGASDERTRNGVVDNHAYSVVEVLDDVAGSGVDLILVRNPWGRGDIENGAFRRYGPGWYEYPEVEAEVEPAHEVDDGVLYLTKDEFFEYFETVYLGASDMTSFLLDGMKMSKHSRHTS